MENLGREIRYVRIQVVDYENELQSIFGETPEVGKRCELTMVSDGKTNKKYGPYVYEVITVNGKSRTTYRGKYDGGKSIDKVSQINKRYTRTRNLLRRLEELEEFVENNWSELRTING